MGYYTHYSGELTISPPLTSGERDRLCALVGIEQPNAADVFNPPATMTAEDRELRGTLQGDPLWSWTVTPDALVSPEEDVKGYDTVDGLILAHSWLQANGHKLEGSIDWAGESNDDSGTIYVDANHGVEAVQDVRDNPGPSWQKEKVTK